MNALTFAIPVFNEADNLDQLTSDFAPLWEEHDAIVVFVNDGSSDGTLAELERLSKEHPRVGYISLSRNFGKEQALAAGLGAVQSGSDVVVMDGDGQHTPEAVRKLIVAAKMQPESDIFFASRQDRRYQGWAERFFSRAFYRLINLAVPVPLDERVGDFFYARSHVVAKLKVFNDKSLFWKGIYHWVGYDRAYVDVVIKNRSAGASKFSFFKKLKLMVDAVVWLTKLPLQLISLLGFTMFFLSFIFLSWMMFQWMVFGVSVPGFYTLAIIQSMTAGIVTFSLGVIALYMAAIFDNTSTKPNFIVSRKNLDSADDPQ